MIRDLYVGLRLLGIHFFKKFGRAGIPVLLEGLNEGDERIVEAATSALRSMGIKILPYLEKACKGKKPMLRIRAIKLLGELGEASFPTLVAAIKHPDISVRVEAVIALRQLGESAPAAIPVLVDILKDDNNSLQTEVQQTLRAMAPHSIPALLEVIKSGDIERSMSAVSILGNMGSEAVPGLIELFIGSHEQAGKWARTALLSIGAPAAPSVAELLINENLEIRLRGARALQLMGSHAKDGETKLLEALVDEDQDVCFRAAFTLNLIENEDPRVQVVLEKLTQPLGPFDTLDLFLVNKEYDRVRLTQEHPIVGEIMIDSTNRYFLSPEEDYRCGDTEAISVAGPISRIRKFQGIVNISGVYDREAGLLVEHIEPSTDR